MKIWNLFFEKVRKSAPSWPGSGQRSPVATTHFGWARHPYSRQPHLPPHLVNTTCQAAVGISLHNPPNKAVIFYDP